MARTIVALMLLVVLMVCARRRLSAPRAAQWMLGGLLLLSPTVHPWYLTWMVALLAVEFRAGWLLLTATVLISYTAKICETADGGWHDAVLIRWIEYLPVYLVLVWGVARTSLTAAKGTATLTTSGSDASRSPAS